MQFLKKYRVLLLFTVISLACYFLFAYHLERGEFIQLFGLYTVLFFLFYKFTRTPSEDFNFLFWLGIALRAVFLFAIPNLSQDFYRFIWDGRLLVQGINPYLTTPNALMAIHSASGNGIVQARELIAGMGALSAHNFSNYPPVSQFCYGLAALFAGKSILGSVIVLRLLIIAADIGTFFFGKKLLEKLNLPKRRIFWYFLNPFFIIELTGNLHFEGVMAFFLIASIYFLITQKWIWSAVLLGLSVSVKLIPLLFLPLLVQYFVKNEKDRTIGYKRLLLYYLIVISSFVLLFLPFLSTAFLQNYAQTIGLWFDNFEFNASIFYIIRWLGFETVGWDIIGIAGKILPLMSLLFLLGITFFRKNAKPKQLITAMLFGICFYYLLSTTVHPWYITIPLVLSIFTRYRFMLIWSFMIVLSYSAYAPTGFDENMWLVGLEYLVVIGYFVWEKINNVKMERSKRCTINFK